MTARMAKIVMAVITIVAVLFSIYLLIGYDKAVAERMAATNEMLVALEEDMNGLVEDFVQGLSEAEIAKEEECLAKNIYFEARNQSTDGQLAVAEVTLNRVASTKFPDSICRVVWQDKQFAWTHDGKSDNPKEKAAWLKAQALAKAILNNEIPLLGLEATHYHAKEILPWWHKYYTKLGSIEDHVFYRM